MALKRSAVSERESSEVLCLYSNGRFPDLQTMKITESKDQGVIPHPEEFIDYITKDGKGWNFQMISAIPEMKRGFAEPYIVFFPVRSQDGLQFPINQSIKAMKGKAFDEDMAWRGTTVVAKCTCGQFNGSYVFTDITMADYALVKNWFLYSPPPQYGRLSVEV